MELEPVEESSEDDAATAAIHEVVESLLGRWYKDQLSFGEPTTPQAIPPDAVRDEDQEGRLTESLARPLHLLHMEAAAHHALKAGQSARDAAREGAFAATVAAYVELERATKAMREVVSWAGPTVKDVAKGVTIGLVVKLVAAWAKVRE